MRIAVTLMVLAGVLMNTVAIARNGSEVLDEVRDDARREAENALRGEVSKRFPYSGSLYGLPGQTRSDSIRESAIRAALGGMFGSCKKAGTVDLGKLPGGLNMDVGGILANTDIKVPELTAPTGGTLRDPGTLIPKPTEVAADQVKVGGSWMAVKDYNTLVAETQAALRQSSTPAEVSAKSANTASKPGARQPAKPAVSKVWAPPETSVTQ